MTDNRSKPVPWRRIMSLPAPAAAVPLFAFVVLAALGLLDLGTALIAAAACAILLAILMKYWLGRINQVAMSLEDDREDFPDQSGPFPELGEAALKFRQSQGRERRELGARATAAETVIDGLSHPLILVDSDRRIVRTTRGARSLLGNITPDRDLSSVLRAPQILEAVVLRIHQARHAVVHVVAVLDQAHRRLALREPPPYALSLGCAMLQWRA